VLVAASVVVCLVDRYLGSVSVAAVRPAIPAHAVLAASIGFLGVTSLIHARLAFAVRRQTHPLGRHVCVLMAGHLIVLLLVAGICWRGATSRTMLAGLETILATLITSAAISAVLLGVTWWVGEDRNSPANSAAIAWPWWALHFAFALAVAGSLLHLEGQPLPHATGGALPLPLVCTDAGALLAAWGLRR
jgi:hypothetical protein